MTTLKQIAERTGVSISVAAKVLNATKSNVRVSEATRQKVVNVAEELHYTRNFAAAAMVQGVTGIIAAHVQVGVSGGVSGPFESSFLAGVESACEISGHDLLLIGISGSAALSHSLHHLREGRIDGLILLLTQEVHEELLPFLRYRNKIVVAGGVRTPKGLKAFSLKNAEAVRIAFERLRHLGHKKIGFIRHCVSPELSDSAVRLHAFCDLAEKSSLVFPSREYNFILRKEEDYCALEGQEGARRVLDMAPKERPTALIAYNDHVALAAMQEFSKHGIRVPQDIQMVGIGNDPILRLLEPRLTTVELHFSNLGRLVARALLQNAKHSPQFPRNFASPASLTPQIVLGNTTARLH